MLEEAEDTKTGFTLITFTNISNVNHRNWNVCTESSEQEEEFHSIRKKNLNICCAVTSEKKEQQSKSFQEGRLRKVYRRVKLQKILPFLGKKPLYNFS